MTLAPNTKRAALLGVVAFVSFAYFYQAGGWNQNSRFDVVRAIADRGQLTIDHYAGNTGDRAKCGDHLEHLCSDKAPGSALTAVPLFFVTGLVGVATDNDTGLYVAGLGGASIPVALAVVALFFTAMALGASPGGAGFSAATFALGTPMFAYATVFFGHALAASCLVVAFGAAVWLRKPGRDLLRALVVGVAAGWAVVTEFPCLPPAVFLAILAVANVERGRRLRVLVGVTAGALATAGVLLVYDWSAFGSPFHIGYAAITGNFAGMKQGFMGVTYPKADVLFEILLGQYRGLFLIAPALALAPLGFVFLWRTPGAKRSVIAALAIVAYFVLLNASYFYWDGGWSWGPRHMSAALPFLALAMAPLWTRARAAWRWLLAALGAVGVVTTLIDVAVVAMPDDRFKRPFLDLLLPAFGRGHLGLNRESALSHAQANDPSIPRTWHAAWNLGDLMGLQGLPSLLPLLAAWGLALALWWRWRERADVRPGAYTASAHERRPASSASKPAKPPRTRADRRRGARPRRREDHHELPRHRGGRGSQGGRRAGDPRRPRGL